MNDKATPTQGLRVVGGNPDVPRFTVDPLLALDIKEGIKQMQALRDDWLADQKQRGVFVEGKPLVDQEEMRNYLTGYFAAGRAKAAEATAAGVRTDKAFFREFREEFDAAYPFRNPARRCATP